MLAGVSSQVFELERKVDQFADFVLALVALDQLRRRQLIVLGRLFAAAQRIVQRDAENVRHQLGDAIDHRIGHAEHAAGISHHGLRRHGAVGDDLADLVAPIGLGDVVDHLVAAVHAEVDVEVGHRHALRVQEALEQQVIGQRIEVGDAQRPGHQRAGAGTTARAHRDLVLLRPADEVGHDQEVAGEAHLDDDAQLAVEAPVVIFAGEIASQWVLLQPRLQAALGFVAQVAVEGFALGHRELRQEVFAEA